MSKIMYQNVEYGEPGVTSVNGNTGAVTVQPTLVSGTNIKTINNTSLLGSGNIDIQGGSSTFVAEFNVTTYADVKDAYDNGAIIVCERTVLDSLRTYQLIYYYESDSTFVFGCADNEGTKYTVLSLSDGWYGGVVNFASTDTATTSTDGLMSSSDKSKLNGIAAGAEVNVQSDWTQANTSADDYIKNKPTIPTNTSDLINDSGFITGVTSTDTPTADTIAEFDSSAHMNSADMSAQDVDSFINNLNASPSDYVQRSELKKCAQIGGNAREFTLYSETGGGGVQLQMKRTAESSLMLSIRDDGHLGLYNVPQVDGEDDWSQATTVWDVNMKSL